MTRAREICQQLGDSAQLFPAVNGVWAYYLVSAEMRAAREVAIELLRMAESSQDRLLLCGAHISMGTSLHHTAELPAADEHFVRGLAPYDRNRHGEFVALYRQDLRGDRRRGRRPPVWGRGPPRTA